jgi:hypothetical protein
LFCQLVESSWSYRWLDSSWNVTVMHGWGSEGETGDLSEQPIPFALPQNMVYSALLPLMRTPWLPVVDWTDAPADLNGLVRFAENEIWFLRVCHHISTGLYRTVTANNIPVSTGTRQEKDAGRESSTVCRRCGRGIYLKDNAKMHTVD